MDGREAKLPPAGDGEEPFDTRGVYGNMVFLIQLSLVNSGK